MFISHYGLQNKITTDSGSEFRNHELQEKHNIAKHLTIPKNLSNCPVERSHSNLIEKVRFLK